MDVRFLSIEQVFALHDRALERYKGMPGVKDLGMIESNTAMPRATFGGEFLHPTIASMAGAYLFHLTQGHGFADGNKRTGIAAALTFLAHNGYEVEATEDELYDLSINVADHKVLKEDVIAFFEDRTCARE